MKTKVATFILLIIVVIIFGTAISFYAPVDPSDENRIFLNVELGSSPAKIATLLKENRLIKNEFAFKLYLKWTSEDNELQAGKYELTKKMNMGEIVNQLTSGKVPVETVTFTIPEGYTILQIAEVLEEKGLASKDRFLELVSQGEYNFDFVSNIPNSDLLYRLEGYLFPKTYEVTKGTIEEELINIMLMQFSKEWNKEWNIILNKKERSLHEVITIASIIEREVIVDHERPIVAGILYNRLEDDWNLQVDATIQYILGEQKDIITYDDLKIAHPFNTYLNKGLPPGPIANPGIESIKAALYPDNNDFYFYVTKKDNTGEHYFARTFEEHIKNNNKSKKN